MKYTKLILVLFGICTGLCAQDTTKEDKPNFILIVADDLGFGDLSLNGSTEISTPNIDRLAKTGVNFTEGYVSSAVCSPSRAGFLTGRNQVSFGQDNNIGGVSLVLIQNI